MTKDNEILPIEENIISTDLWASDNEFEAIGRKLISQGKCINKYKV